MGKRKVRRTAAQQAFLAEVEGLWPLAKGSVAEVRKPCIRPTCPACRRGEKHPAFLFTYMEGGRKRCLYVPRALVPTLRKALENGRRLERVLGGLGPALIRAFREARRGGGRKGHTGHGRRTVAPLLAAAMGLWGQPISDRQFYRQAAILKRQIVAVMSRPARHPAVQGYQTIFREKAHRLYHWAEDRAIPAENNFAERELRPLVVARKVSFGSQSEAGARTREVLMSVLLTLKKRVPDVTAAFQSALDRLAAHPALDSYQALFPDNTS